MRAIEKKLAEQFNLTREEIKTIVNFSYAELERQLLSDGLEYEISGIGVLKAKPNLVEKEYQSRIAYNKKEFRCFTYDNMALESKRDRLLEMNKIKPEWMVPPKRKEQ